MRCIYFYLSFSLLTIQSVYAAPTYPALINSGNAYTGEGGDAKGGDVLAPEHHDLLDDLKINLLSSGLDDCT
jgi:hypothetical protein